MVDIGITGIEFSFFRWPIKHAFAGVVLYADFFSCTKFIRHMALYSSIVPRHYYSIMQIGFYQCQSSGVQFEPDLRYK